MVALDGSPTLWSAMQLPPGIGESTEHWDGPSVVRWLWILAQIVGAIIVFLIGAALVIAMALAIFHSGGSGGTPGQ